MTKPVSDKSVGSTGKETQASDAAESYPVTIDEFCRRLSRSDRRVELIGAFHADEKRHARVKDMEANYRSRFDIFAKRPVTN